MSPPVADHHFPGARGADWEPLATLALEAAHEATPGGGAFGYDARWILAAMQRALQVVPDHGLGIAIVSFRSPSPELQLRAQP